MGDRFKHSGHLLRMAAVFATGVVGFLIVRAWLVPSDFGVYGFYRAGALDDAKARTISYSGRAACEKCHSGTYDPSAEDLKKKKPDVFVQTTGLTWPVDKDIDNKHAILGCEACHGPLAAHSADEKKPVAKVGKDELCLTCHRLVAGRPSQQPQIVPGDDHGNAEPCANCHKPHRPKPDEEEDQ